MQKLAIVLHGKLGDVKRPGYSSGSVRSVDGARASPQMITMCFASLVRHIVQPNTYRFQVDVVGHSWSPEVGGLLDALFRPLLASSRHEPPPAIQGFRCANPSLDLMLCHRTWCQLLGVQRALALKRGVETQRGGRYDAVLLSRWDVLW